VKEFDLVTLHSNQGRDLPQEEHKRPVCRKSYSKCWDLNNGGMELDSNQRIGRPRCRPNSLARLESGDVAYVRSPKKFQEILSIAYAKLVCAFGVAILLDHLSFWLCCIPETWSFRFRLARRVAQSKDLCSLPLTTPYKGTASVGMTLNSRRL